MQLGYITIGYNDAEASSKFYDAVFGALGSKRTFERDGWVGYGTENKINVMIVPPFDKQAARGGNGIMLAFRGESKDQINAAHSAGLANGGADEGAPGERNPRFYGAYLRDPAGNKICFFCSP